MTRRIQVLGVCAALVSSVALVDLLLPGQVLWPILYVAAVLVSLWSPVRSDIILIASICIILTGAGASRTHATWEDVLNRFAGGFAIAATTLIGLRRKRLEEQLGELNRSLEEQVGQTAAERDRAELELREQQAVSKSILDSLPLNVFRKDLNGRFVFANQRFCDDIGRSLEQIVGNTDLDFSERDLAEKYREDDKHVAATGNMLEKNEEHLSATGEKLHVHVMKGPVRDADGRIVGTQGIFWDVTARVRAEEAQKQADARFRRLVNANIVGIITADFNGCILDANDAFLKMIGYTREELEAGKIRLDQLTPLEYREKDAEVVDQLRATGVAEPWEKEYWGKNGRRIPILIGVTKLEGPQDECISFVLDITERKRAEVQLRAAKEAADSASQAKTQFLAKMSHEFRTPLHQIFGLTELLQQSDVTPEQREQLSDVRRSGESLMSVLSNVLDFSNVETGMLELKPKEFALRECIGDAVTSQAVKAHQKHLELASDIQLDVPEFLIGDEQRLRQVIVNLVNNAIKFTESGEVVVDIRLDAQNDRKAVLCFAVKDTGIGIPKEIQSSVFSAFEQADPTLTRKFGGTGLGLAIASSLVKLMGGQLRVESEVNRGSTFYFELSFELAGADDAMTKKLPVAEGRPGRVLVVDDSSTNRRILREMLANWGMQSEGATGAEHAVQILTESQQGEDPFRLVLIDSEMPDTNGFALVEQIQQEYALKDDIIMMLSSSDQSGDVARCEQLALRAYLTKPVKQSELLDAITLALGAETVGDTEPENQQSAAAIVRPLSILLAEDSLVNQKLAVGLLQRHGHSIVVANNGTEAVAAVEKDRFDLILMDVQMPEMDGLEATRKIRSKERSTGVHVPIVAMTAHAMQGDREQCLAAGMDDYIAKPIRTDLLYQTIAEAVNQPDEADESNGKQNDLDAVDWSHALTAVNDDEELLKAVIDAFLEEAPQLLRTIEQAIAEKDDQELRRGAHTLKGSMRLFGAHLATEFALRLEIMGRDKQLDDADATRVDLEKEMSRLIPSLEEYMGRD